MKDTNQTTPLFSNPELGQNSLFDSLGHAVVLYGENIHEVIIKGYWFRCTDMLRNAYLDYFENGIS